MLIHHQGKDISEISSRTDHHSLCQPWCGFSDCACVSKRRRSSRPSAYLIDGAMEQLQAAQHLLKDYPDMVAVIERAREDLAGFSA